MKSQEHPKNWLGECILYASVLLVCISHAQAGTSPPGFPTNLSVNVTNFPHLKAVLATEREPRIVWFGDSTGADAYYGVYNWLTNTTVEGVQSGLPFIGWSIAFPSYPNAVFYGDPFYLWGGRSACLSCREATFFTPWVPTVSRLAYQETDFKSGTTRPPRTAWQPCKCLRMAPPGPPSE